MSEIESNIEIRVVTSQFGDYEDDVVKVYQDAYSRPPYNESEDTIQNFRKDWSNRIQNKDFLLVMAYISGVPAGMAYGWTSNQNSQWHESLRGQLGDQSEKWLSDNFESVDFAVSSNFQGRGIGSKLYGALISQVKQKTALLYTHQSGTAAYNMYLKSGWEVLRDDLIFKSGNKFVLMGKQL